jgi:YD repeat-containing protein
MMRFSKGRLISLRSDTGRQIDWAYSGNFASRISEGTRTVVTVKLGDTKDLAASIVVDGEEHSLSFDQRPRVVSVHGQQIVEGIDMSLSEWRWPDATKEIFAFGLTDDRLPKLEMWDREKARSEYVWQPSGIIQRYNDWSYSVASVKNPFEMPRITRIDSSGNQQDVAIDAKTGKYTTTRVDGVQQTTSIYKTPGPLYNKVRSVEERANGKTITTFKAAYDTAGRLLRKVDSDGLITKYAYNDKGKLVDTSIHPPVDPEALARLIGEERTLLERVTQATDPTLACEAIHNLGMFYIHKLRDASKALELLPRLSAFPRWQYGLRIQAIDHGQVLSNQQKIGELKRLMADFPEQREQIEMLIRIREPKKG